MTLGLSMLSVPEVSHAEPLGVGCNEETNADGSFKNPCGFDDLMQQIQKLINFLLFTIAMPVTAIMFAYAGFLYIASGGNGGNIEKAKGIFKKVLIGFVLALAAWLIVKTIMVSLGYNTNGGFDAFFN